MAASIHNDSNYGLNAQIYGTKTFVLFAPGEHQRLYAERISDHTWVSPVSWEDPDLERHPEFAAAEGQRCTLEIGDMLYLPPFWWHSARAETTAINVNAWYITADIGTWVQ